MIRMDEFAGLDATALAGLVKKGEVTPQELTEAAITAVEAVNPSLNAVICRLDDEARQAAGRVDLSAPFAGVPFLMKDIGAMLAGAPLTLGTRILKEFVPDHDSELTRRYKKAGFVMVGKTNTPEFGLLPTTEPEAHGPSRNPWDTDRTTGGSSGGSSAMVAARAVPAAHANDGGGSIRIPASCCGVFGLKPTRARNPLGPDFGDMLSGLVCEHVVTRSVRDSAAILDATAGPDLGDPYCAPPNARPFAEEVAREPKKLKIAVSCENFIGEAPHPDCESAVKETAALLTDLGHRVEWVEIEIPTPTEAVLHAFMTLWTAGCASTIDTIAHLGGITPSEDLFEPVTMMLYEEGKKQSASAYLSAVTVLQRFTREMARFFRDWDLLLTPVLAQPPVPLGTFDASKDGPRAAWARVAAFAPYTAPMNATGQPAMSVPLTWNKEDLPIGSHFVAPFGDEATLFQLAAQLEKAKPWADKKPPVSV